MITKQSARVVDYPPYADFPRSEYDHRIGRARTYMESAGIDVLVVWDATNIRYFTGFRSGHWGCLTIQPAVFVLPLESDPIIIVPDFFSGVAEGYTYLDDIRLTAKPHRIDHIRQLPVDVARMLKDLGHSSARIGIESSQFGGMTIPRPVNDIDCFRAALEGATFVPAGDDVIWRCRVIKSPAEVEAIRHATKAVIAAYGEIGPRFELGMSEYEFAAALRRSVLAHTEDCQPPIARAATARPVAMPDTPSFHPEITLSMGDRIVCEPLPTYKGYFGSCARVFQVGPLSDETLRRAKTVDHAQDAAMRAVRPGVLAGQLVRVVADALREGGLEPVGDEMSGHSTGLGGHEPPMIAVDEDGEIMEGMVLAIEVWAQDWWRSSEDTGSRPNVFGVEDLVVVTRNGCDPLPSFPRSHRSLPFEGV